MSGTQKFLRVRALDGDGERVWETALHTPTWGGYSTKYVTEGSPDKIAEITEGVSQYLRERALDGRDVLISARIYDSKEEADSAHAQ